MLNELAIFAGAGGGLIASKMLGWNTVCAVELDGYSQCVLIQRQNDGILRPGFPIWDDARTFDGRSWRGVVDVISGGFPCQAFSTAAAGRNIADDLWPEMRRVIGEAVPRYVFAENVSKLAINRAGEDLEQMGYQTKAISLGAKDLGGDHIRTRYWLLAYADDPRELLCGIDAEMAVMQDVGEGVWSGNPRDSGMANGVAYRMDRVKATGNGQVPIVAVNAIRLMVAAACS